MTSDDERDVMREPARAEPMFNIPGVVVLLALVMVAITFVRSRVTVSTDDHILGLFAFISARYSDAASAALLPGGIAATLWSFVTYAFLHSGWAHLINNLVWMIVFGAPVARRFGNKRFLILFALCAAAGAVAQLALSSGPFILLGASASVAGIMAAALRFMFEPAGMYSDGSDQHPPAQPLSVVLRQPRPLIFMAVWLVLNIFTGVFGGLDSNGPPIAWQAHLGGFLAGLIAFVALDPVPRR